MTLRTVMTRVLAVVSGAALLGAAGGTVVLADRLPAATVSLTGLEIGVPAAQVRLACLGPPRIATAAVGEDLDYDEFAASAEDMISATRVVSIGRDGDPAALGTLSSGGGQGDDGNEIELSGQAMLRQATVTDSPDWHVVTGAPVEDLAALVTGTSASLAETGDLRGLDASACLTPTTTSWLVGGHTMLGGSSQLVLANPGFTPVSADIEVWGATGPIDSLSAAPVVVAPGQARVVLLEALVPDEDRLVVRVSATGGQVAAAIVHSDLDGLVAGGISTIVPGAEPGTELVVPGIVLGEEGSESADRVRLANPGAADATVTIDLLGPDGVIAIPGGDGLVVDAGTVTDLSLAGLTAGEWSLRVRSDEPVTAGVRLHRTAAQPEVIGEVAGEEILADEAPADSTWLPAGAAVRRGIVALPADEVGVAEAVLVLANASEEAVAATVRLLDADGGSRTVDVELAAGHGAELAVDPAEVVALEVIPDEAELHGALWLVARSGEDELVGVLQLSEDPHVTRSVELAPVPPTLS